MTVTAPSYKTCEIDTIALTKFLFTDADEKTRLNLIVEHAKNANIKIAYNAAIAALLSFVAASWTGPLLPVKSPQGCLQMLIVDNEG
jgi:DNA-binding MurR/RpiR family transcriptional regulator